MNRWDPSEDEPLAGPGKRMHDPDLHGRKGRSGEPGSRGPGSRRSLYRKWLDTIEPATFGKVTRDTVTPPVFSKNLRKIEEELPEGTTLVDVLPRAWEIFAADIRSGQVKVRGKDTWFVFFGRRAKYIDLAQHPRRQSEIEDDDSWI